MIRFTFHSYYAGGITYALDQTVLGSGYFSVDSTGGVFVKQSLDSFSAGQALSLTATVTDTGELTGNDTLLL